jgi:hypothetical protein
LLAQHSQERVRESRARAGDDNFQVRVTMRIGAARNDATASRWTTGSTG